MSTIIGSGKGRDDIANEVLSHVQALRRYALVLIGQPADADDLVQDTLTRALGRKKALKAVKDLRAYLFTTLHNVFIDTIRRQSNIDPRADIDVVMARMVSPAAQQKRLEVRDLVSALGQLPIEQREVVLLVGLEGMSYQQAADTVDVPIGTVMSRLSRGREALRRLTSHDPHTKLRIVK